MITVIIPAMNQEKTIGNVVTSALATPGVSDVIVVDEHSADSTLALATSAGARPLQNTNPGRGSGSMDGIWFAAQEVVVFLDGDLIGNLSDMISELSLPIVHGEADYQRGILVSDPLLTSTSLVDAMLHACFSELSSVQQVISGIGAARRSLFRPIQLEADYGASTGLLIDVAMTGATLAQTSVQHVCYAATYAARHDDIIMQSQRVILDRAQKYQRKTASGNNHE